MPVWHSNGAVLSCNLCQTVLDLDGTQVVVAERARIRGWVIFDGTSMSGAVLSIHLCSECSQVARIKPPVVLEGQGELF